WTKRHTRFAGAGVRQPEQLLALGGLRQFESRCYNRGRMRRRDGGGPATRADPVSCFGSKIPPNENRVGWGTLFMLLLLPASGCGYHTAGKANLLPSDLRTLAVPAFVNQTPTYKIEQMLTAAVVQEFSTRTKYRIITQPDSADAVLRGTVLTTSTTP